MAAFSSSQQQIVQSLLHPSPDTPHPRLADRRVRIVFNGVYVVDTTQAAFVWEHPYFPQFYVPGEALKNGKKSSSGSNNNNDGDDKVVVEVQEGKEVEVEGGKAQVWMVVVKGSSDDKKKKKSFEGLYFKQGKWIGSGSGGKVQIEGLLRVNFRDMDAWYEEDSQIYGHPKDPTKRIFLLPSSRPLVIKIGPHTLVDTTTSGNGTSYIHLIEPLLPVRYYLPPTAVAAPGLLRPSSTRSVCPYKGEAEYYDVVVKGEGGKEEVHRDLVWYYKYPTLECSAVAGMLCFYNEKVDVWLDGEKLERPKSKFA